MMKRILILLVLLGSTLTTFANHLVGGDFWYEYVSHNNSNNTTRYLITIKIYRECDQNNPALPTFIYTNAYLDSATYPYVLNKQLFRAFAQKVSPNCKIGNRCIEEGYYSGTIDLPNNDTRSYWLTYGQCCRDNAIVNITNPGSTGQAWVAFIPRRSFQNSSPSFLNTPLTNLCRQKEMRFNVNAFDKDGDSLAFKLVRPYRAGSAFCPDPSTPANRGSGACGHIRPTFLTVNYAGGYSETNPLGNTSSVKINNQTGEVTIYGNTTGFFAIAIEVEEWRKNSNGTRSFMGAVRRDVYVQVVNNCPSNQDPFFDSAYSGGFEHRVRELDTLRIPIKGVDLDGDTIEFTRSGPMFDSLTGMPPPYAILKDTIVDSLLITQFLWVPSCAISRTEPYFFSVFLKDEKCAIAQRTFAVTVFPRDSVGPPSPRCADVEGDSTVKLVWRAPQDTSERDFYYLYRRWGDTGTFEQYDRTFTRGPSITYHDYFAYGHDSGFYQYFLYSANKCGDPGTASDTIASMFLRSFTKAGGLADLRWNKHRLRGTVNYRVERWTAGAWAIIGNTTDTTFEVGACNDSLRFRVSVLDTIGNCTSRSNMIWVPLLDTIGPQPPVILQASVISHSRIDVTFRKSVTGDAIRYRIFRDDGSGYAQVDSINSTADTITRSYANNINTANYCFKITAIDSCGNEGTFSIEHCPVNLAGNAGNLAALLTWPTYKGYKVDSIRVQRLIGGQWTSVATLPGTRTGYNDSSNLGCNQPYYYRIISIDSTGTRRSLSDSVQVIPYDSIAPPAAALFNVSVISSGTVRITWPKSTAADVKDYILQRSTDGTNFSTIDTVRDAFQYDDRNLSTLATSYFYRLIAMDSCSQNKGQPGPAHRTIVPQSATAGCSKTVTLRWNRYNGFAQGVDKYEIYKALGTSAETLIGTVSGSDTIFADTGIIFGNAYSWRVRALERNGNLRDSWSDSLRQLILYPQGPEIISVSKISTSTTNGSVEIRWDALTTNRYVSRSQLFHATSAAGPFTQVLNNIPNSQTSYVQNNLNTSTADHYYYMKSVDSCNNVSDSVGLSKTMNVSLVGGQLTNIVNWTPYWGWKPVQQIIHRRIKGQNWAAIDTVNGDSIRFQDNPAPCYTTVSYYIEAVGPQGQRSLSDIDSVAALDTVPAAAPVLRNVSVTAPGQIRLDYNGSSSRDAFSIAIERSQNGGPYQTIDYKIQPGPNTNSVTFIDNTNTDTVYNCYRIAVQDSCLNITFSQVGCAILLRGTPGNKENNLTWNSQLPYTHPNHRVEWWSGTNWIRFDSVNVPGLNYRHAPVSCDRDFRYKITAQSGANVSFSNEITIRPFDTLAPNPPAFRSVRVSNNAALLQWQSSSSPDVLQYEIWKGKPGGAFSRLTTVPVTQNSFTDNAIGVDSVFSYFIISVDSCNGGNRSVTSDTLSTIRLKLATGGCRPFIALNWNREKAVPAPQTDYEIFRSVNGGPFNLVGTTLTNAYTDSNVITSSTYSYRIVQNPSVSGISGWSDSLNLRPFQFPVPTAANLQFATVTASDGANGSVMLNWRRSALSDTFVRGYNVYYSLNAAGPFSRIVNKNNPNDTTHVHSGINTLGAEHFYYVKPYNQCDVERDSSGIHKTMNLSLTQQHISTRLNWTPYQGFNVREYRIRRFDNGMMQPGFIAVISGTSPTEYVDSTISCGNNYRYRIEAVSDLPESLQFSHSDIEDIGAAGLVDPPATSIITASVGQTGTTDGVIDISFRGGNVRIRSGYKVLRSINGGPFSEIATVSNGSAGVITHRDQNINTTADVHAYKIIITDSCGRQSIESDVHQPVNITVQAVNQAVQIDWTGYIGFGNYEYVIERRTKALSWSEIVTLPSNTQQYFDSSILCQSDYYYRIRTVDLNQTGVFSFSDSAEAKAYDLLPPLPIYAISASVDEPNTGIQVTWARSAEPDILYYELQRKSTSGVWNTIYRSKDDLDTTFFESNMKADNLSYCYRIRGVDLCENIGQYGNEACTILLSAKSSEGNVNLEWTPYRVWPNGVQEYEIWRQDILPFYSYLRSIGGNQTSYIDQQLIDSLGSYCYQVVAIDRSTPYRGQSRSNTVCVYQKPIFFMPNAFTPGTATQGLNDYFGPVGSFIADFELTIFNRWGQIIFEGKENKPYWDGTYNGSPAPDGAYMYQVRVFGFNGVNYEDRGVVNLIR